MILVDAHVHVYPEYDRAAFLDAAARNFARYGGVAGGVLMLAERSQENAFDELQGASAVGDWHIAQTDEHESLLVTRGDTTLVIVAGRQIATLDGLEVLSLGSTQRTPDGLATVEALHRVVGSDALAVLPWGVGKWSGARRELVAKLLDSTIGRRAFVGDNAGRLRGSATPTLLTTAIANRQWMLPGTDPLPIASEARRAGQYGLVLQSTIHLHSRPAEAIRQALRGLTAQPPTFGELTAPLRFLRNQAHMQLRKRLKGKPLAA